MRIHVVNLKRSPDRRAYMREQLDRTGLDYVFFDAVDASAGQLQGVSRYDEAAALRYNGETLLPGELGCFASHYRLWQQCAQSGEPMLVLEDDVALSEGFTRAVQLAAEGIARYGFMRLAVIWQRPHDLCEELEQGYRVVRYRRTALGTQCYALSPAAASALLQHADVWVEPVDRYLERFWLHGLHSYVMYPLAARHATDGPYASLIGVSRRAKTKSGWRKLQFRWLRIRERARQIVGSLLWKLRRPDRSAA